MLLLRMSIWLLYILWIMGLEMEGLVWIVVILEIIFNVLFREVLWSLLSFFFCILFCCMVFIFCFLIWWVFMVNEGKLVIWWESRWNLLLWESIIRVLIVLWLLVEINRWYGFGYMWESEKFFFGFEKMMVFDLGIMMEKMVFLFFFVLIWFFSINW